MTQLYTNFGIKLGHLFWNGGSMKELERWLCHKYDVNYMIMQSNMTMMECVIINKTVGSVSVERHLWDHNNPYYGCRGVGLRGEQG